MYRITDMIRCSIDILEEKNFSDVYNKLCSVDDGIIRIVRVTNHLNTTC